MKNKLILMILLLGVCLLPIRTQAEELKVTLKSISLEGKSEKAIQAEEPTINGYKVNLNIKFEELNDYLTYKIIFENKENKDYNLSLCSTDEYVKYELLSTKIKKNTDTEITLKVIYIKELPEEEKGKQINNEVKIKIKDKDGKIITNPKTGQNILITVIILLLLITSVLFVLKKKKTTSLFILLFLLIPGIVYAAKTLEFIIHSTYEVKQTTETKYTTNITYASEDAYVWIGKTPTSNIMLYNTPEEAKEAYFSGCKFYLKHILANNIVKESYTCFEINNNTYCLRGLDTYNYDNDTCKSEYDNGNGNCVSPYYESNKSIMQSAFSSSECTDYGPIFRCISSVDSSLYVTISINGDVCASETTTHCCVNKYGASAIED